MANRFKKEGNNFIIEYYDIVMVIKPSSHVYSDISKHPIYILIGEDVDTIHKAVSVEVFNKLYY